MAGLQVLGAMVTDMQLDMNLDLDRDEQAVMKILRKHRGRQSAVKVDRIVQLTGINERQVRDIVRHLIHEHRAPVGSSTQKPYGYYWIVSGEEAEATVKALERRGISVLTRAADIKRITLPELLGQLKLELEDDETARSS